MREIYNGFIIPDFVVRPVEVPTMGVKPDVRLLFRADFDYMTRDFTRYCMTERDLAAPALREFFESTTMVMNMWEDPNQPRRWFGERFTPEQYMDLVHRCEDLAYRERFYRDIGEKAPSQKRLYVAQYGKAKWPTGGGRNAHSAGKFFFADRDVTGELYRKYLLVDPNRMNPREQVSRTAILFGNSRRFGVPPRIVLSDYETGGTAIVDAEYAAREGIEFGDKLWPVKASAIVSKLHIEGADMVIPKDAIKFEEHRDASVLASLMGSIPELSAVARSSVQKDRLPKMAFDTMQWLYPEMEVLLNEDVRLWDRLALVRRVVEGEATAEEMASLAQYTDPQGNPAYPREFNFLLNGHPKEDPKIRDAVLKVAATAATKALCFRVKGEYGVAMPLTSEAREMTVLMPPWMLPFRVHGSNEVANVIGVESDWAIGCLGKDYDGDLAMSLELSGLLRRIGLSNDVFPDWHDEKDKRWVKAFMALPDKLKEAEGRSASQVMADGLKSYGLIGIATNKCAVVLDAMRATGFYTRQQLMGVHLRMMSTVVQPFVDALKYDPKDLKAPILESRYSRSGRLVQKGLAEEFGIDWTTGKPLPNIERLAVKVQDYFRAVRGMKFEALSELPEDDDLKGSFYYRLSRLFAGWKVYQPVNLELRARELAAKCPITDALRSARSRSFPMFNKKGLIPDALASQRWEYLRRHVKTSEDAIGLVASCWIPNARGTRDIYFGLWLGKKLGVDIVRGTCEFKGSQVVDVPQEVTSC